MSCSPCGMPECPTPMYEAWTVFASGNMKTPCAYLNPADGLYYHTVTTQCAQPPPPVQTGRHCDCYGGYEFDYTLTATYTVESAVPLIMQKREDDNGNCVETVLQDSDCSLRLKIPPEHCKDIGAQPVTIGDRNWVILMDCSQPGPSVDVGEPNVVDPSTSQYSEAAHAETSEEMIARIIAQLPAFGDKPDGAPIASRQLSPDGSSFSCEKSKYRFRFIPSPSCKYKLTWTERFTPAPTPDGAQPAPIDTPRHWTWEPTASSGSCIPDDFDLNDTTTWPVTDEYTLDVPDQDGMLTVVDVKGDCAPS